MAKGGDKEKRHRQQREREYIKQAGSFAYMQDIPPEEEEEEGGGAVEVEEEEEESFFMSTQLLCPLVCVCCRSAR